MLENARFVIIRLSSIGDVLHATPVARTLKNALPDCHITWVVGQVSSDLLKYNPFIDQVYVWSRERFEQHLRKGQFRKAWQMVRQLRNDFAVRPYDIALDIHGLLLSGMVTAATGASRRIGLSGNKEPNWLFMNEKAPLLSQDIHVIQHYLSILRPLGIETADYHMTLCLPPESLAFAEKFLASHGVQPGEPVIVMSPATTWPAKNWPAEYFAQVADNLRHKANLVLCGGPADQQLAAQITAASQARLINAVGSTTLLEMAALLKQANVVVTGDTGPLHMAVALGVPSVSIFGPTDPARFGPLQAGHIVLQGTISCAACHKKVCPGKDKKCMYSVFPEMVIAAVDRQLAAAKV